ncbi:hypothetical protein ANAEL_02948 [Anaerolineales bacterium]|nr:hypothetical protein ANAEL_02948 [Anaerolineales bacterium]
MKNELKQQLKKVLSNHLDWLSSELEVYISKNDLKGKLLSYSVSNDTDLGGGYISYFPHNNQEEEAIELSLMPSNNSQTQKIDLLIDIYWSDGTQIQDLIDYKNIDTDKAVSQINLIIEQSKFKLLSEMKKQISLDRPPHYRED